MSKDDKPTTAQATALPAPRLTSIEFANPLTLNGVTPKARLALNDGDKGWDVAVQGASVFLRNREGAVVEVPRSQCILRWAVDVPTLDDAVRAIAGRK